MVGTSSKALLYTLVLIGLAVLVGDIVGDVAFFQDPERRTMALLVSAALRNLLTLVSIAALFVSERWAAWTILVVGLLGLGRRLNFVLPVMGLKSDMLLVHSGADLAFRALLLGVGIGWFAGRGGKGD